jgi:hypothetical protein
MPGAAEPGERRIEILLRDNQGRPVAAAFKRPPSTRGEDENGSNAIPKPLELDSLLAVVARSSSSSSTSCCHCLDRAGEDSPGDTLECVCGGKRFRPALLLAVGQAFSAPSKR